MQDIIYQKSDESATTPFSSIASSQSSGASSSKSNSTYVNPFDFYGGDKAVAGLVKSFSEHNVTSISEKKARQAVRNALPSLQGWGYQVEAVVGWGANGVVVSAFSGANDKVRTAVKVIYKTVRRSSLPKVSCTPQEIILLSEVEHDNVIRFLDHFEDETAYYLVTEYIGPAQIESRESMRCEAADGSELSIPIATHTAEMHQSSEEEKQSSQEKQVDVQSRLRQIVQGLCAMHEAGITHGDLKLGNCLVNQETGQVKVCDFGFASRGYRAFYGSQGYAAPELIVPVLQGRPSGREADIWAAGLILLQLLGGHIRHEEFKQDILQGGSCQAYPGVEQVQGSAGDLLRGMLRIDAARRMTAQQILSHPYLLE
ncbi:MAG: hypothetical protein SGCHY_002439 [Lobulomycetales sp.]